MLESISKDRRVQATFLLFILLTIWWVLTKVLWHNNPVHNQLFAASYGVMALWGAFWGLETSKKWGWAKSVMGKVSLMFALGLFAQEFGQLVYSYYIYFWHREVPYPSIGDLGYFGSIPLYISAVFYLGKASGVKMALKSFKNRIQAVLIPLVLLLLGYLLFLRGYTFDWSNPLTVFLDFGYPIGEAIYISLAILVYLLSKKVLGGIMRNRILFILFALLIQFFADYMFLYKASRGVWYAGGLNDYVYLVAYFIMTLALLELNTVYNKIKNE